MNRKQAALYYKPEYGYIITPYAKKKDSILRCVIEPVITVPDQVDATLLGEGIVEALDITQNAQILDPLIAKDFEFWKIAGIKRLSIFSKIFRAISIVEVNGILEVVECKRHKTGEYVGTTDDMPVHLPLDSSAVQIGKTVIDILSERNEIKDDTDRGFTTLDGNRVTYTRPPDSFLDVEDGNTDAYQIYVHEEDNETYIAFLIDNPYKEVTEAQIRKKWQQWYGELIEYRYQETSDASLKVKVSGKTMTSSLASYLYQDGEMLMEVTTHINLSGTSKKVQKEIQAEFERVINSITVVSA